MSKNIIITSDSTCDLSPELIERYGIKIIPMGITLGDKTFRDGTEITPDEVYAHHSKTGELPKTTAINLGEFEDFFAELSNDETEIVHFNISSTMSSTFNNSRMASEDSDNIFVIDSHNLSTGTGLLILAAAEMAKAGKTASEIYDEINRLRDYVDASFVIDSLEYLYKGGRCSALSMLGANLLKLKPCIEVKNGSMGVGKKYRGKYSEVLKEYAKERLADADDIELDRVFVTHAGVDSEIVNSIVDIVKETLPFKEVFVTRAGCTVSSHCGANTLGVLFVRKSPIA